MHILPGPHPCVTAPPLSLEEPSGAGRLEGWPRMTAVQAAILRDDRLRYAQPVSSSDERNCARAGMRSRAFELIGFLE